MASSRNGLHPLPKYISLLYLDATVLDATFDISVQGCCQAFLDYANVAAGEPKAMI